MLRVLCLVISLCCFGDAAPDLEQLKEMLASTIQLTVPTATFTRIATKDDGLKLNTRGINWRNLIVCNSGKAQLRDKKLHKKYCIYIHGTEMVETSSTGVQLLNHVFVFVTNEGVYPTDSEVDKMLETGIIVIVDVGERQRSLSPVLLGIEVVKIKPSTFGLRIPQERLCSFGLHDLSLWSSISYMNAAAETINLETEGLDKDKKYCYAIPMNKAKHPVVPDNVKVAVIETDSGKKYGLLEDVPSLVVKVYNSGSFENKVQLEFGIHAVTNSLMLKGYQDGSNKVRYMFEQPIFWQLVKFKATSS